MSKWFNEKAAEGLHERLLTKLDKARDIRGKPIRITSGLRTPKKNKSIPGSVEDSSHLSGLGVDCSAPTSAERFELVQALLGAGFKRIGIYKKHVHADDDETKPQNVMWIG